MSLKPEELYRRLTEVWGGRILAGGPERDCVSVTVARHDYVPFMRYLRDDEELSFPLLSDYTAVDYPSRQDRFELVAHVFSLKNGVRLRVKTGVPDGVSIPTLTTVWSAAEWLEREIFDMFGIRFDGHPNLVRILMTDDFKYHPLRKEFPVTGIDE